MSPIGLSKIQNIIKNIFLFLSINWLKCEKLEISPWNRNIGTIIEIFEFGLESSLGNAIFSLRPLTIETLVDSKILLPRIPTYVGC